MAAQGEAQQLVHRYFAQLTAGCGRPTGCHNTYCAGCRGGPGALAANDAALLALRLAQQTSEGGHAFCADVDAGYLDMESAKSMLAAQTGAEGEQALKALILRVFSDPDLLERSFPVLPPPRAAEGEFGQGGKPVTLDVDWAQLTEFWAMLGGGDDASQTAAMMEAVVESLRTLLVILGDSDKPPPESPRAILLALTCPALTDPQHHETLLLPAYALLTKPGPTYLGDIVVEAWTGAPEPMLRFLVRCLHEHMIFVVLDNSPLPEDDGELPDELERAVEVLGLLHAASEASAHPLELSAFYNDGVNNELCANDELLRQDHRRWQDKDAFSFCAHPFILEPASKASVLKLNAMYQMSSEFEGAVFRSLLTMSMHSPYLVLRVRREHLIRDSLHQLASRSADLKKPLKVTLAHGLQQLLEHTGDVRELCLTFSLEYDEYGARRVAELLPGGAGVEVTNENRRDYVDKYAAYVLDTSVAKQFKAFHGGFVAVCGGPALELFHSEELELLVCGSPHFDFEALQKGTIYDDGFTSAHPTIRLFWEVLHSLDLPLKRKFLVFSTGSDRVPIKGLGNLKFVISRHGSDELRLPSAHTCFNHLLLPEYKTDEVLRKQLLKAITDTEGFHIV
ncbi:hypothetical protein T492DRAFT_998747 [Pavlovales sp. CCMP2436]|nr:hypothetical protein T492DRAFT_998747 [Pavlovales sp. CCMP2436]